MTPAQGDAGRLPLLVRGDLDPEQLAVYDAIVNGPRARDILGQQEDGWLPGPFNAMVVAPRAGLALQRLGSVLRYEGSLPAAARELAILLCARAERSAFEWYAHEPLAAAAGVPQPMIDAIASGATPTIGDPVSDAVVKITASVIEDGDVSDEGYAAASRALSEAQLVEVLVLIGYYRLISGLLRVFRVPLPADARSPFSAEGAGEGPTG